MPAPAKARDEDVRAIVALNNRFAPEGLTLPRSESFVASHLDDYRVARDPSGALLGCACLDEYSPSLVELVSLAVAPWAQGKGIGRALIAAATDLARRRGYPELFAVSFSDELFRRAGFVHADIARYPEKKRRYDPIAADEWTIGQKHCFARALP